jgi:hypothetical protein
MEARRKPLQKTGFGLMGGHVGRPRIRDGGIPQIELFIITIEIFFISISSITHHA